MNKSDKQKQLEQYFKEQSEENRILNRAKSLDEFTFRNQLELTLHIANWLKEAALGFKTAGLKSAADSLIETVNILENHYKICQSIPFEDIKSLVDEKINKKEDAKLIPFSPKLSIDDD